MTESQINPKELLLKAQRFAKSKRTMAFPDVEYIAKCWKICETLSHIYAANGCLLLTSRNSFLTKLGSKLALPL